MTIAPKIVYAFGPYRLDPDKERLLRDGQPVPVTPKAFEVLLALVRRSREVVSKDELMRMVWPHTVVEEANLSQSIFMLRKALGDTSGMRHYIVTLPGCGYRFAEPVREITPDDDDGEPSRWQPPAAPVLDRAVVSSPRGRWRYALVLGVALIALLVGASVLVRTYRPTTLAAADPVLVADFVNRTGDPVFDDTLRQGLAVQLQQSPLLSLISQDRIQQTLRMMDRPADVPLTPALAREICERTSSSIVLDGSIAKLGSAFVVGLQARDCASGEVLDTEQAQAMKRENVLGALDEIAGKFRTRIGESGAMIARHNTPLAEATTTSLDALKAYSQAVRVQAAAGSAAALPLFQRAVAIDPDFAMADAMLGRVYGDIGDSALSMQRTREAWRLRNHSSDAERFFIEASYQLEVTGNMEAARRVCESWIRTYPRAMVPQAFLAGIIEPVFGNYRAAVEHARAAIALDPAFVIGYGILAYGYQYQGDLAGATRTLDMAAARKLTMPELVLQRYDIAFLRGNKHEMGRQAAMAKELSGAADWMAFHQALALAYHGRVRQAGVLSEQATALAMQDSQREHAGLFEAGAAWREAMFGDVSAARRDAGAALTLSNNRYVEFGAAFALAVAGDSAQARALADDLRARFPEDTSMRFSHLPALYAQLEINDGRPAQAIDALQIAAPYDLGVPRSSMHGLFGALATVYVRGEAYLGLHRGAEAAAEFRKILANPGVVESDPVGALARLQLARAYAMHGDKARAKAAYRDLGDLWKSADPDVPAVRQAMAESVQPH
jgi:DNA-binding winged helix-turn-helix (wHTH) protein/tetratricopeptide (TPR) repeat protein